VVDAALLPLLLLSVLLMVVVLPVPCDEALAMGVSADDEASALRRPRFVASLFAAAAAATARFCCRRLRTALTFAAVADVAAGLAGGGVPSRFAVIASVTIFVSGCECGIAAGSLPASVVVDSPVASVPATVTAADVLPAASRSAGPVSALLQAWAPRRRLSCRLFGPFARWLSSSSLLSSWSSTSSWSRSTLELYGTENPLLLPLPLLPSQASLSCVAAAPTSPLCASSARRMMSWSAVNGSRPATVVIIPWSTSPHPPVRVGGSLAGVDSMCALGLALGSPVWGPSTFLMEE
jgi:hypothetical protein